MFSRSLPGIELVCSKNTAMKGENKAIQSMSDGAKRNWPWSSQLVLAVSGVTRVPSSEELMGPQMSQAVAGAPGDGVSSLSPN